MTHVISDRDRTFGQETYPSTFTQETWPINLQVIGKLISISCGDTVMTGAVHWVTHTVCLRMEKRTHPEPGSRLPALYPINEISFLHQADSLYVPSV